MSAETVDSGSEISALFVTSNAAISRNRDQLQKQLNKIYDGLRHAFVIFTQVILLTPLPFAVFLNDARVREFLCTTTHGPIQVRVNFCVEEDIT